MAAQQNTHRQHRRKISFADLERTYRAAGPILPPPPHGGQQAHLNAAQVQQQRLEDMRRQDAVRRIRNKPTDRDVPDELSSVIVGDGVERYSNLRDVERQLDAVMMRKRLDIADNLSWRYTRREGVLRVWVSNTVEGQPWQVDEEGGGLNEDGTFEFAESSQATFRVKLEGRLLDDPTADEKEGEAAAKSSSQQRSRFSRFFKSITVDFHRNPALQPDGYSAIEWKKSQPQPGAQTSITDPENPDVGFDTLEFQRKSDENINVTINLMRDEKNERYKLSPQLAEIVDTDEDDRAGVVQGIWEYCRAMGLQEDEDKRSIVCDEPLRKVSAVCGTALLPYFHTDHTRTASYSAETQSTSHTCRTTFSRISNRFRPSSWDTPSASTKPTSRAHQTPTPPSLLQRRLSTTFACLCPTH